MRVQNNTDSLSSIQYEYYEWPNLLISTSYHLTGTIHETVEPSRSKSKELARKARTPPQNDKGVNGFAGAVLY
jgi:hypothetical protein